MMRKYPDLRRSQEKKKAKTVLLIGSMFVADAVILVFYPTKRSDNKSLKDLFVESFLTDEQLEDFNFSDTMVKFKVLDMMKKAGIRGSRNGRNPLYPERSTVPYKYYALKIEPAEREIYPDIVRHYEPDERFEFRYDTIKNFISDSVEPKDYLKKLCEAF